MTNNITTNNPTTNPTPEPTPSPTNGACKLNDIFEFALVVDNSCGFTHSECDLQKGQIAESYGIIHMLLILVVIR